MSAPLVAESRLVGVDRVYRAPDALTAYVVDVIAGRVIADIYHGTSRGERIRIPRATFQALFCSNYQGKSP